MKSSAVSKTSSKLRIIFCERMSVHEISLQYKLEENHINSLLKNAHLYFQLTPKNNCMGLAKNKLGTRDKEKVVFVFRAFIRHIGEKNILSQAQFLRTRRQKKKKIKSPVQVRKATFGLRSK